ncbi:unnamed protein product [Brassica rapa subsp. narinosa]
MGRRKQVFDAAVSDLRSLGIQIISLAVPHTRQTLIQTPTSRAPPVPTERGDDAKPFAPMVVTVNDDGLGPVSWWEGSTSNENMKMMMIPEPNFNLQMNTTLRTMRVSLANQYCFCLSRTNPSYWRYILKHKNIKFIVSFLRS